MTLGTTAWAADWVYVDKTDDGTQTTYIDKSSIHRTGNIVQFWQRADYVNDKNGWKSDTTLYQVDCITHRGRWLSLTIYYVDGNNRTQGASDWAYTVPETMGETAEKFVCKR
jgi:hypothetical protein